MSTLAIEKVYDTYALFYDQIFGKIFDQGRHQSTMIVNQNAPARANVLELGVGTGLSLPLYRPDLNIHGIDISEKMLKKAQKRIDSGKVAAQVSLKVMDAEALTFKDNSFDFVVALYVASVVSNIDQFLNEICRVCRPGGEVIFVNHFSSNNRAIKMIEKKIGRIHSLVGFKSDFSMDPILNHENFQILNCHKTNLFGYWKVLHCKLD